MINDRNKVV
jgi:hypothetical protein